MFKRLYTSGLLLWLLLVPFLYQKAYNKHSGNDYLINMLQYDQEGYYMYLPATFVFGEFRGYPCDKNNQFKPYPGTDRIYTKYPCGVALMQTPFYLTYLAAQRYQYGYAVKHYITPNAVRACLWGAAFYTVLGLFFLYKTLRRFISNKYVTAFAVFAAYLGSCAYYYTIDMAMMAHIYGFTVIAIIMWFTPCFYTKPTYRNAAIMGLLSGLLVLLRATNVMALLYVLLWEVYSFQDFKARLQWFFNNLKTLFVLPILMFIPFLPQMYCWHYWSGNWILYAYQDEGFSNWRKPEVLNVLFSRQNGLFTYSPILYGSAIGSFLAFKYRKISAPVLLLISFCTVYVFSSWWQWFFGGCYGARSFVDFTPFYALGLGFLYQYLYEKPRKIFFYFAVLLTAIAIFYSIQMTYLYVWPWMDDTWTAEKFWWTVGKAFYINK